MQRIERQVLGIVVVAALAATGCATKRYVEEEVGVTRQRIDEVQTQVEANQGRLHEHDMRITEASSTAQEALQRAIEAGKLAEGKFLFETVLSDEKVKFPFDSAELSPESTAALDEFASQIKTQDAGVFIEIQGHTDSTGAEHYNLRLGEQRAEAAWRYLNQRHDFPLARMNTISYGQSAPVADNGSRDGRAQNRRVVLVVLR